VNEQVSILSQTRRTYEAIDQSLRFRIQDDFLMAQASARLMKLYTQPWYQGNWHWNPRSPLTKRVVSISCRCFPTSRLVLDYEMSYYDEALNYALALSRLEEMTGQVLNGLRQFK